MVASWPYNTGTWKRLRAMKLAASPTCERCEEMGRFTVANTVDHRLPISGGGDPFPSLDGLASMCAPCHSAKTARGAEAGAIKTRKPRTGCNPDGTPLDGKHPWHAKSIAKAEREAVSEKETKSLGTDASRPSHATNIELIPTFGVSRFHKKKLPIWPKTPIAKPDPLDDGVADLWD